MFHFCFWLFQESSRCHSTFILILDLRYEDAPLGFCCQMIFHCINFAECHPAHNTFDLRFLSVNGFRTRLDYEHHSLYFLASEED